MANGNKLIGLINNEWDRDNLKFLLTSDQSVLDDWYKQADEDDLVYARELISSYAKELELREELEKIESKLYGKENFPEVTNLLVKIKEMK